MNLHILTGAIARGISGTKTDCSRVVYVATRIWMEGGGRLRPLCKFFQGAWLCKHGGVAGHFILLSLMSNSHTVVCSGG